MDKERVRCMASQPEKTGVILFLLKLFVQMFKTSNVSTEIASIYKYIIPKHLIIPKIANCICRRYPFKTFHLR